MYLMVVNQNLKSTYKVKKMRKKVILRKKKKKEEKKKKTHW